MRNSNRLTALAFMLAAPGLMAQETTGTLVGTIKGQNGTPIASATVQLTGGQLLGERRMATGQDGNFRLPLLPAGSYELTVYATGFIGSKATFYINAGSTIRQDLTLKLIEQKGATVEIIASAAQVDKTETTTKTSFSTDQLVDLTGSPVQGGSIAYNALALSPGVVGNVQYASIRGGSQMATNYVINGVSSRDNVTGQARLGDYVLDDTIEDTAVIQSPLNAKFGGSSSGIVSVVTKRGSNEFSGTFRAKLSDAAWSALPIPFNNRLGATTGQANYQVDDLNRTWEISFSGPIIKDKLTFAYGTRLTPQVAQSATAFNPPDYGMDSVRYNGANLPANLFQANALETAVQKSTFNQFQLFYQITQNHSLEANYTEVTANNPDLQYNYVTPDATISRVQTTTERFISLAYRGILGSNQLLDVRYGKNRSDTQFPSGPGTPIIQMAGPGSAYGAGAMTNLNQLWDATVAGYNNSPMTSYGWYTGGAGADTQPDKRTTESFVANYNIQLDWKGSHSVDVGIERQQPIWGTVSLNNTAPAIYTVPGQISPGYSNAALAGKYIVFPLGSTIDGITYSSLNDTYTQNLVPHLNLLTGPEQADVKNPTDSIYLNDMWTLNDHWSVMGGLRYDRMKLTDASGTRVDSKMLSPRFEVKWDVNGDQKRLVNFSYGQFRGLFNARFYRTAVNSRKDVQETYYWTAGTGMQAVDYATLTNLSNYTLTNFVSPAMYAIDPNWKPECNNEFTLGYRRTYDAGGYWRATIVHRKWTDLTNVFPILSGPTVVTDGSLSQQTYTRILTNDPNAKREYNGFEFEFSAPLTEHLLFGGNFVFSSLTGDNVYGDGTSFGSAAQTWAVQGNFRNRYEQLGYSKDSFEPVGPLQQSRPVVLKYFLTYHVAAGRTKSSVSLQGDYISGTRVNLTNQQSQDPNLIPFTYQDPNHPTSIPIYFDGRGQFSQPDTWHLNLIYNVDVALQGKVHFFSQLAINNVLNSQIPASVTYSGSGTVRTAASAALGYRPSSYTSYGIPVGTNLATNPTTVDGARTINLDLGLKF